MDPCEAHRLKPGTAVWIWVVRLARGRWWPGTVEHVRSIRPQVRVTVRFECRRANSGDHPPVLVGITTTAMRYLELRQVPDGITDRPRRPPVSLLERPEEPVTANPPELRIHAPSSSPLANSDPDGNADFTGR